MMDKMLKDIKNSLKIQNKSMFVKQNLSMTKLVVLPKM